MAIDSTKFKPLPENKRSNNNTDHGWVEHNLVHGNNRTPISDGEQIRNLTLAVPAKMTMSAAEYVCENGAWMRLHATENIFALPKCFSETDVGKYLVCLLKHIEV